MSKKHRAALGKGIHSLLPARNAAPASGAGQDPKSVGSVSQIPTEQIQPNPGQPRRDFDSDALLELAQSIERDGIIQPILLRRTGDTEFQIIAGERRWRAAKIAGLTAVPAVVRHADDQKVLELALIENIQRQDLNPIELAMAFHRMATELGLSHEEIGAKTGKDRATITNAIRLLQLPSDVQELVAAGKLSAGHARALLKIDSEEAVRTAAKRCIEEAWSVRQAEEFTKAPGGSRGKTGARPNSDLAADPNVKAAVAEFERVLGTRVRIVETAKDRGRIEIDYFSSEELQRLYELIVTQ